MSNHHHDYDFDELENFGDLAPIRIRNMPRARSTSGKPRRSKPQSRKASNIDEQALVELAEGEENFDFSYTASRHEREWILNSLGGFYDGQWIDDVLRLVKGGKEAHVYQCLANSSVEGLHQPYIAAKVYRPRRFRNLRNDHMYREGRDLLDSDGRLITDDGMLHAIHLKTSYGQDLLHASWIEHEYNALKVLHNAGADVPTPLERGNNAILMAFVGDEMAPAPTLNSVDLEPEEAGSLFERVMHNIELMLAKDLIHGDLSAFNILYWQGEITLIDFPQVVAPRINSNAFRIFERDIVRICEYFNRQGIHSSPKKIARELWTAYGFSPEIEA
jgi:RIO kinase 1